MRPVAQVRVPAWGLAVVLEGLSLAPFKPMDLVSEKFLTLRMEPFSTLGYVPKVPTNMGSPTLKQTID